MEGTTKIKSAANASAMVAKAATANAVAKPVQQNALSYLQSDSFKKQIQAALPKFFDTDRFTRSAISEFRLNPGLQECTVPSVLGYFMQAAMMGLEPGSALGQCYAVPFNKKVKGADGKDAWVKECQYIIGYRGLISLARRSGDVMSVSCEAVHENDDFELTYGLEQNLVHKPCLSGDPGELTGVYCIVRFKDGSYQMKYMPKFEIEKHRMRSKSREFGPWKTDYEEMAKKTCFRAIAKYLPISIEGASATASDENVVNYKPTANADASPEDAIEIEFVAATPDSDGVQAE